MTGAVKAFTISELLGRSSAYLDSKGFPTPRLDAELLLADVLGMRRLDLYLHHDRPLSNSETDRLRELLRRRAGGEPIAYILGRRAFRSLDLSVDDRVLVPRPETEGVVEVALGLLPEDGRLLDVGTGSGAIALSVASERRDATVIATDVSAEALAVARANAEALGLQLEFVESDLLAGVPGDPPFDVVVANLPYIARDDEALEASVREHEPAIALFADESGLALNRRLAEAATRVLKPTGALVLEVGSGQADAIRSILEAQGYNRLRVDHDLAGLDRVVSGRRAEELDA